MKEIITNCDSVTRKIKSITGIIDRWSGKIILLEGEDPEKLLPKRTFKLKLESENV